LSSDACLKNDLDFDPDALREKYRRERDKRLRTEGSGQYVAPEGDFSYFVEDPYTDGSSEREPLVDEVEVLVVGGGFAGLLAGAYLRQGGIDDIRIVEKGGDFGGTWYWNRYPGIQCDIESYVYLPLLEETGYIPKDRYASGAEIWEHAKRIATQYDLYRGALFSTKVTRLEWLENDRRWLVSTSKGDQIRARFVVQTNGLLDRPKLPGIPGIDEFEGHTFHTSRWDYDYTGGDAKGGLTGLSDKKVAIIGTGATAIQVVPHLSRYAEKLYVIQRTPSSVDARTNRPTDFEWVKSLPKGWQRERVENFVALTSGQRRDVDLVGDGWTDAVRSLGGFTTSTGDVKLQREIADFKKMNQIRSRVETLVEDPGTAEALKPWYRQFCKRPTFSDFYLDAFNRPNVELVDTDGQGLGQITPRGFSFGGRDYDVDCIIFATGFDYGSSYSPSATQAGHPIVGRTGATLVEEFRDGLRTLHGFYTSGFPNLFQMGGSQNGTAFVTTYYLNEQAEHIAEVLKAARERSATLVEATPEAEADWVAVIRSKDLAQREFQRECTPGFYNQEGKVGKAISRSDEVYGGGPIEFYGLIRDWRARNMPGLRFE
jgi:cation diffusion facilitator CzcD-associated flavoprotein CzcO